MKKILFMVSFMAAIFAGGMLFGDPAEAGYSQTGYFLIQGRDCASSAYIGAFNAYYDDALKSMVIRISSPYCTSYYYCIENDNPKMYGTIFNLLNTANGRYFTFWYKVIAGKNIIKSIGF